MDNVLYTFCWMIRMGKTVNLKKKNTEERVAQGLCPGALYFLVDTFYWLKNIPFHSVLIQSYSFLFPVCIAVLHFSANETSYWCLFYFLFFKLSVKEYYKYYNKFKINTNDITTNNPSLGRNIFTYKFR